MLGTAAAAAAAAATAALYLQKLKEQIFKNNIINFTMSLSRIEKIVLIGAGNVATNLALALKNKDKNIVQIYSHTEKSAKILGNKIHTSYTTDLNKIVTDADLYIVAVTDSSISSVVKNIHLKDNLIVHTSGSVSMEILKHVSSNFGVFYPLQTFTKTGYLDFDTIPVCIEANTLKNQEILSAFAKDLSKYVYVINSEKRKILHLSAVFACNFTNYMYYIAEDILKKYDIDFDILRPLIKETADKIAFNSPYNAQTGPAIRKDIQTINQHLDLLSYNDDYKKIYDLITGDIMKHTL